MNFGNHSKILLILSFVVTMCSSSLTAQHEFNGEYQGRNLDRIAFPIGGIGAGMFCMEGTGALSHVSVKHQMDFFKEPTCFAALCVLGDKPENNVARVLEGPIPDWKYFGRANSGNGAPGTTYGLPRFTDCTFSARFPFAEIRLNDKKIPIAVTMTGWSPFIPNDAHSSGLPTGAIEYRFTNTSAQSQKAVFSFSTVNFMNTRGSIGSTEDGFILFDLPGGQGEADAPRDAAGGFAFFVKGESASGDNVTLEGTTIDHCWFKGGWWDPLTITWDNIEKGRIIDNPASESNAPGATIFVPLDIKAGETKVVRLLTAWYVPTSNIAVGKPLAPTAFAFDSGPSRGRASQQQPVSGFQGKRLVNSFHPHGDNAVGTLTSPKIKLDRKYIHFLLGGGTACPAQLLVEDKVVRSATGQNTETLKWVSWNVSEFIGKEGVIKLVDLETGSWGHINADHFMMSDLPINEIQTLTASGNNSITTDADKVVLLADFEGEDFGSWTAECVADNKAKPVETTPIVAASSTESPCCPPAETTVLVSASDAETPCCPPGTTCPPAVDLEKFKTSTYVPWYATKFNSVKDVVSFWSKEYGVLKRRSEKFSETFYDTTLPPEVVEAVAANITILKSPTVLRQYDGKLWCWEGCHDGSGCCAGSCTHVWNYAQAICHLFPELERSLRETEHFESQDISGRQAFRANLPISPGGVSFDAADGQLGGIMKVYREWKISGSTAWLKKYWSRVKLSMDFMIEKYDPRHTGLLEEDHHNTYDINYFGPDGHCGSFYLGALQAMIEMGEVFGEDVALYRQLLEKGKKRMIAELYNGEYFIQIVQKEGLNHNFTPINPGQQGTGYREIAEKVNEQGPKYQYGTGCLSDGVLGLWMAKTSGMDTTIIPEELVKNHLLSVYKYNFRSDLSQHANPQRPSYAMGTDGGLLLCTWPRGEKPLLPFVYSDEVWTGIEYQVASHLMMHGCVDEGLEIVKAVRKRHDGVRRNPFNEYECGHWYARAMASYGLLQGLTGVRYDAFAKTLYVDSQVGDFRSFLSTATGYGTVVYKNGKATLEVVEGTIPVERVIKRGK